MVSIESLSHGFLFLTGIFRDLKVMKLRLSDHVVGSRMSYKSVD